MRSRNDGVGRAVQALDALDDELAGADAPDPRAHGDEAMAEVDDLGLARGVAQNRLALGKARRHQQVLGRPH